MMRLVVGHVRPHETSSPWPRGHSPWWAKVSCFLFRAGVQLTHVDVSSNNPLQNFYPRWRGDRTAD